MEKPGDQSPSSGPHTVSALLCSKIPRPLKNEVRRTHQPASVYHTQLRRPWTSCTVLLSACFVNASKLVSRIRRILCCSVCFLHQRAHLSGHHLWFSWHGSGWWDSTGHLPSSSERTLRDVSAASSPFVYLED